MPLGGQSLVAHAARNLLAARAAGDERVRVTGGHRARVPRRRRRARARRGLADDVASSSPAAPPGRRPSPRGSRRWRGDRAARRRRGARARRGPPARAAVAGRRVIDAVRDGHPAVVPGRARDRHDQAGRPAPAASRSSPCWRPSRAPSCAPSRRRRGSRASCCAARTRTARRRRTTRRWRPPTTRVWSNGSGSPSGWSPATSGPPRSRPRGTSRSPPCRRSDDE